VFVIESYFSRLRALLSLLAGPLTIQTRKTVEQILAGAEAELCAGDRSALSRS